jgi:hypothetical protein
MSAEEETMSASKNTMGTTTTTAKFQSSGGVSHDKYRMSYWSQLSGSGELLIASINSIIGFAAIDYCPQGSPRSPSLFGLLLHREESCWTRESCEPYEIPAFSQDIKPHLERSKSCKHLPTWDVPGCRPVFAATCKDQHPTSPDFLIIEGSKGRPPQLAAGGQHLWMTSPTVEGP